MGYGQGLGNLGRDVRDQMIYPGPIMSGEVFHCFAADCEQSNSAYFTKLAGGLVKLGSTAIADALADCTDNAGDMIVLHGGGGDWSLTSALTVNKGRLKIMDSSVWLRMLTGVWTPSDAQVTFTPATAIDLFTVTQDNVQFMGLDIRADLTAAQGNIFALDSSAAANCAILGGQLVITNATVRCIGIECDAPDLMVKDWKFLSPNNVDPTTGHFAIVLNGARCEVSDCLILMDDAAGRGVHMESGADGCRVLNNYFHMEGTTGDTGVLIDSGATYNVVRGNDFNAALNADITNNGGATNQIIGNNNLTLIANNSATTASLTVI